MSRPLRIEFEGAFYHITSRGNARQPIFEDAEGALFAVPPAAPPRAFACPERGFDPIETLAGNLTRTVRAWARIGLWSHQPGRHVLTLRGSGIGGDRAFELRLGADAGLVSSLYECRVCN